MLSRNAFGGARCRQFLKKARSRGVREICRERKHPVIARQPRPHFHLRPQMCVFLASRGSKKLQTGD